MSLDLPEFYFRTRDNGAIVFRVDTENRQHRIEMTQMANINLRNGEIKPHGNYKLSEAEVGAIQSWMEDRKKVLGKREVDDIFRAVDFLHTTAQWAQARATNKELDQVTDGLLLAMHDLRSVLVRKKSERLLKSLKKKKNAN